MFPLPILTWVKMGAAIAVLLFAYWKGYSGEHEKFVKYKADVAALGQAQEELNKAIVQKHDLISRGIADEYEAKLSAVHNYYAERVRDQSPSGRDVPTPAKPAVRIVRIPANAGLTERCAATTLQLVQLQKWVGQQYSIK